MDMCNVENVANFELGGEVEHFGLDYVMFWGGNWAVWGGGGEVEPSGGEASPAFPP